MDSILYAECPCRGQRPAGCMLRHVEQDAAAGDEEAAKVLDYEPDAICEDCPLTPPAPAGTPRRVTGPRNRAGCFNRVQPSGRGWIGRAGPTSRERLALLDP